jgi:hypothetical protein
MIYLTTLDKTPYGYKFIDSWLEALNIEVLPVSRHSNTLVETGEISHQVFADGLLLGYVYCENDIYYTNQGESNYGMPTEAALELIPPHVLKDVKQSIEQRKVLLPDYM